MRCSGGGISSTKSYGTTGNGRLANTRSSATMTSSCSTRAHRRGHELSISYICRGRPRQSDGLETTKSSLAMMHTGSASLPRCRGCRTGCDKMMFGTSTESRPSSRCIRLRNPSPSTNALSRPVRTPAISCWTRSAGARPRLSPPNVISVNGLASIFGTVPMRWW